MNTLHPFRPALVAAAAALPLLLAAGPLSAQDANVLGNGPPQGKTLSRAQLRDCLQLQNDLESRGEAALKSRKDLDAAKAEFDRFEAQLQTDRGSLDASNKTAVDAYNARLEERRRMVADYEGRRPQVAEQAQRYDALHQEWKGECENRPYREADYAAVAKD